MMTNYFLAILLQQENGNEISYADASHAFDEAKAKITGRKGTQVMASHYPALTMLGEKKGNGLNAHILGFGIKYGDVAEMATEFLATMKIPVRNAKLMLIKNEEITLVD